MKEQRRYAAEYKLAAARMVVEQGLTADPVSRQQELLAEKCKAWLPTDLDSNEPFDQHLPLQPTLVEIGLGA